MESNTPLTKAERRALKKEKQQSLLERQQQQAKLNRILSSLVIVGIVVGMAWWAYSRYTPVPEEIVNQPTNQVVEQDWVLGNANAPVVLVEYSDFQCPACKAYREVLSAIHEQYQDDQVALVFRHFPLKTIHPQATLAAQAAEAAGLQGKFWEMHDKLFDNQQQWSGSRTARNHFMTYAKELSLDIDRFTQDIDSSAVKAQVEGDYRSGMTQRINSTPSFFLNGNRIANPQGVGPFLELIAQELQQATASASPSAQP